MMPTTAAPPSPGRAPFVLALLGTGTVAVGAGALAAIVPAELALVGLAVVFVVVCLRVPVSALPAVAVFACCFNPLPYSVVVSQGVSRFITPGLVVLTVWLLRRGGLGSVRWRARHLWLAVAFVAWLGGGIVVSDDRARSIAWSVTVLLVVVLTVAATRATAAEARSATSAMLVSSVVLGAVAAVEGVLQRSVLGSFFDRSDGGSLQHWSVFRVTTFLGHPLVNALFFASAGVLALAMFVSGQRRRLALAALCASVVGQYLTVSLGGVVAFGLGATVVVALLLARAGVALRWKVAAVGGCLAAMAAFLLSPLAATRLTSDDGRGSLIVRQRIVEQVLDVVVRDDYLGSGPGTSIARFKEAGYGFPVESSVFQLLISLGAPGLLIVVMFVAALLRWLLAATWTFAAAVGVAFLTMLSTFSVLDDYVGVLALFPLLVLSGNLAPTRTRDEVSGAAHPVR